MPKNMKPENTGFVGGMLSPLSSSGGTTEKYELGKQVDHRVFMLPSRENMGPGFMLNAQALNCLYF